MALWGDCFADFRQSQALSLPTSPYISAVVAPTQASISGPPDIIATFIAWIAASDPKAVIGTPLSLCVTAPYHASHLYSDDDVARVVAELDSDIAWPNARIPVVSSSDLASSQDAALIDRKFPDALREAIRDCLTRRIGLDVWPSRIAAHISSRQRTQVSFDLYAVTNGDRLVPTVRDLLPIGKDGESSVPAPSPHTVLSGPSGSEGATSNAPIAILSVAGRFPQASDMDSFWSVLLNGVDTHELAPAARWDTSAHVAVDPKAKNVSGTGFGCWLHDAGQFDAQYFNMSPREAPQVDPAQRLALLTATEALERAGIVPNRTPSTQKNRVGVYFGSTSNDWMETNSAQDIDTYFIPGGNRAFIPGRINYHFKFSGPRYVKSENARLVANHFSAILLIQPAVQVLQRCIWPATHFG